MPRPSKIARRIIQAREARDWSKSELARRAHIDPSYVSRLESGEIVEPSPARLDQLAAALGVPPSQFLEGEPEPGADARLADLVRSALGTEKAHLFEATFEALRELTPNERDRALEVIHVIATNWPSHREPR